MVKKRQNIQRQHYGKQQQQQQTTKQTKGLYLKEMHFQTQKQQKDKRRLTFSCHRRGNDQMESQLAVTKGESGSFLNTALG